MLIEYEYPINSVDFFTLRINRDYRGIPYQLPIYRNPPEGYPEEFLRWKCWYFSLNLSSTNHPSSSLSDQNILPEEQEVMNLLINEMKNENSYHYEGDISNHDDLPIYHHQSANGHFIQLFKPISGYVFGSSCRYGFTSFKLSNHFFL